MALKRIDSGTKVTPSTEESVTPLVEQKFNSIIAQVEDYAVILLDEKGNILSWNRGAEKIKGYSASEIIGKNYKIFYPSEDVQKGLPDILLEQAISVGKVNHEGWRVRKNGYRFWASVTLTLLRDPYGEISGIIKVTRDLTEKKIAEDRYSNMLEELRLKNEELQREEERYHKMVSEVQDYAIILLDPEGKILDWNKGAERVKGYTTSEIVGKNFRLFYPPEEKEAQLPQRLLKEAADKGFVNHEGYRVRKDGTRFWGNVAITALHDAQDRIIGFSKVTKDLTERKAAEDRLWIFTQELQRANEALRMSEERYHRMISEVQDYAILMLNTKGEIQNWNTGAELIKGYTASEIVGKSFKAFYLPDDVARGLPDRLLQEAQLNGRAYNEGWRKKKDGSKFWASVTITALHDSEGSVIGYSKVTRDLTEKKKSDDALKENALQLELKNHELETLNAELSSFAYVVSHDFKEPIRKIQVFAARQLEPNKSMEQIVEFSKKIIASAERMQQLMESLLSYSRISNENSEMEEVDLNETIAAVKNDLELMISESGAEFALAKMPVIKGIPFQLHQMFLNLIGNSIKFSKPGQTPRIEITTELVSNGDVPEELIIKNRSFHRVTIADNGIGFEPGQAERIFEVFRRLEAKGTKGTGIGLAIVKKVALNHDGLVRAESIPQRGSKFHVYLPARI